jgi:hypothetical protein
VKTAKAAALKAALEELTKVKPAKAGVSGCVCACCGKACDCCDDDTKDTDDEAAEEKSGDDDSER